MAKRGKKYVKARELVSLDKRYTLSDALDLLKKASYSKFVGTVDLAINLGVDPRHADQNVRGAALLPHGSGKVVRIIVFAKGQKAVEAKECDVEAVGGDDLAEKISAGWMDFDQVLATPDMMGVVGRLGKVLGPRGLMPNPKLGTVTFEVKTAIKELKSGRAEFRVDKAGVVHTSVGKASMETQQLVENAEAVIDSINKAKPSSAKGAYLKKMSVSATMSPGLKVDVSPYKI
ncbi:MAG: 50S ribosomal protein L1 [Oligoflexales bacterium]|nr:50S ribosomal protein L1 [Oligoflexales bacterium]